MDEALKKYLQTVQEEAARYESGSLETKEYLQSMQDMEKWLEEQCDENPRN